MCININSILFITTILIFILIHPISSNNGTDPGQVICNSIDIRNSVKNFHKLKHCTVVEGSVQIVLIDNGVPKDYENLSFPNLKEITDYLLLYRAFGLQSVGKLFPNLSVIRGKKLFHDYALVVYEMFQLQELALNNLTTIVRGAVRIEKNHNLCFSETIDWNLIAPFGTGTNYIQENKPRYKCPPCNNTCKKGEKLMYGDTNGRLCWNAQTCQIICKCSNNKTCLAGKSDECCSDKCLGGCTVSKIDNKNVEKCISCRGFLYKNECVNQCPPETYEYLERRCVDEEECKSLSVKFYENKSWNGNVTLKAINGKCTPECPTGYTEDISNKYKCVNCKGECPKICRSASVNNIATAQTLRGCTEINGSLEIFIQNAGDNILTELERSFEHLVVIRGFLKISRSNPLISLNFLRKLKVIKGEALERGRYSFLVIDNPNLEELWSWEKKTSETIDTRIDSDKKLKIDKGKIFFHINPKLCYNKIERLKEFVEMPEMPKEWEDIDVSQLSNGDKVACEVSKLNVTIWFVDSEMVGIKFSNFKKQMADERSLLGYLIHYKEALHKNVTIFDGVDACQSSEWKIDDYEATGEEASHASILPRLKPFTQYALYIKTYTIASERKGAQSDMIYFTTKPDTPSQPRNVIAKGISDSEIKVEWDPPIKPNGVLTHYFITINNDFDSSEYINQRNYCTEPLGIEKSEGEKKITGSTLKDIENRENRKPKQSIFSNLTNHNISNEECCVCKKKDEDEVESRNSFEDYLINIIYVRRTSENSNSGNRKKRETTKQQLRLQGLDDDDNSNSNSTFSKNKTDIQPTTTPSPNPTYKTFKVDYNGSQKNSSFIIKNLTHFTEYTIQVQACQDNITISNSTKCSVKAITSARTEELSGANNIDEMSIKIENDKNSTQTYFVRWEEPKNPNGLIVSYSIIHSRILSDNKMQKSNPICITRLQYKQSNKGWSLFDLHPGNYSIQISANTIAGAGNWTASKYFYVIGPPPPFPYLWLIILISVLICFTFIGLAGFIYVKYRKNQAILDYVSVNPEYISAGLIYDPDPAWEVPREKISVGKEIGDGSFGKVFIGELQINDEKCKCALKTVKDNATPKERIDFLNEANAMKSFVECNHVVKLLGIVSVGHPVYVIMEYMAEGDLRTYLRNHRPSEDRSVKPPSLKEIFQMAIEIADGMLYLSSKKFVHRDLAARNCMVSGDLVVKIGDFGMARDIYETDYYRKGGRGLLPVRWMSPESLKDGEWTSESDIWSYGVVLWEMVTLGHQPYQGLANEQVLRFVMNRGKMQRPENCPEKLWYLMDSCWNFSPKRRPRFEEIVEMLMNEAKENFSSVSFYHRYQPPKENNNRSSRANNDDHDEAAVPLRQAEEAAVNIDEQEKVHFFPSRVMAPEEDVEGERPTSDDDTDDIDQIDEFTNVRVHHQSNGNTNVNVVSDGSKGSKISTTSNGSLVNGHSVQIKTTSF